MSGPPVVKLDPAAQPKIALPKSNDGGVFYVLTLRTATLCQPSSCFIFVFGNTPTWRAFFYDRPLVKKAFAPFLLFTLAKCLAYQAFFMC
jgi:hypothetical protein